ncbi:hypothetical protein AOQ84DRAFT_381577 [Glonium stellatum]|uniref:Uncharacterized protein n=1 Tax=Glonium stellatum TaxID=574774 RepID=A0A8E2ESE8_9PEZI|nr:hypothetical protein AOQ84DRAFT_381577 [Glonium stellatum]
MNTIRSVGYGWGVLIVAGGGAYYFAKKSINADRQAKAEAEQRKRQMQRELETSYAISSQSSSSGSFASKAIAKPGSRPDADWYQASDDASNPSHEASHDPAPTRHAPEDDQQRVREKSKYESLEPFRSRKGDRFS